MDALSSEFDSVLQEYVGYNLRLAGCRTLLDSEVFSIATEMLQKLKDNLRERWKSFRVNADRIRNILLILLARLDDIMNSKFIGFMDKTKDFVKSTNNSLINVQNAISSLKDFFFEIDTRS